MIVCKECGDPIKQVGPPDDKLNWCENCQQLEGETIEEDYDPTPYCSWCFAMTKAKCKCGPRAEND